MQVKERILIVEDEPHIARVLELELRHEGYEVTIATDGLRGLELAGSEAWSLIVLDVMLPGIDGLELLRRLRAEGSSVPVLLLTARDTTDNIVEGLDLGAGDYVTKPFAAPELLARIRSLIRLSRQTPVAGSCPGGELLHAAGLSLHTSTRKVERDGQSIELTPTEFELLHYMLKHQGEVLSRDRLIEDVWGYSHTGDTNVVDVYIRYLRQKIDQGYRPKLLQTVRGVGYRLEGAES
ncbi:response regulator transcription factor [Paenibacillus sp. YYML68]|uniref:response regulator transcription factor n=1 Tax=Paenibacillus sp. YYML68 TaxID=2909250 RepID=UPI002852C8C3|nr:response regulator transcription factor [Paenibacillus sp. YYML68]